MFACCCATDDAEGTVATVSSVDYTTEKYSSSDVVDRAKPEPAVASTEVFEAELVMADSGSLGILLDNTDEDAGPMIIEILSEGIVALHNATCPPGSKIEVYDRVESVNGKALAGKSSEEDLKLAALERKINVVLRRPILLHVALDKSSGKPLGVNMSYKKGSSGIVIKSIDGDGLLNDWNTANLKKKLTNGDRIIGIDQETKMSHDIIDKMKNQSQYTLMVMHYNAVTQS